MHVRGRRRRRPGVEWSHAVIIFFLDDAMNALISKFIQRRNGQSRADSTEIVSIRKIAVPSVSLVWKPTTGMNSKFLVVVCRLSAGSRVWHTCLIKHGELGPLPPMAESLVIVSLFSFWYESCRALFLLPPFLASNFGNWCHIFYDLRHSLSVDRGISARVLLRWSGVGVHCPALQIGFMAWRLKWIARAWVEAWIF